MGEISAALSRDASKEDLLSIDEYAYFGGTFNRTPNLKLALEPGDSANSERNGGSRPSMSDCPRRSSSHHAQTTSMADSLPLRKQSLMALLAYDRQH